MIIEKVLSITELIRFRDDEVKTTKEWLDSYFNSEFDMTRFNIDTIVSLEDNDLNKTIRFQFNTVTKVLKMLDSDFLIKQGEQNLKIKYYSLKEDRDRKINEILNEKDS